MSDDVLLPSAHHYSVRVYHLPSEDGPERPRCRGDVQSDLEWRTVSRDHPAVAGRRVCRNCKGDYNRVGSEGQRTSLADMIARGEVEVAGGE